MESSSPHPLALQRFNLFQRFNDDVISLLDEFRAACEP
jgi:hypothetical protein